MGPCPCSPLTKINSQKVFRSAKTDNKRLTKSFGTIRKPLLFVGVLLSVSYVSYAGEQSATNSESVSDPIAAVSEISTYEAAAAAAEERERAEIDRLSKKIVELNTNADRDGKRRAELQNAVDNNAPGAAQAIGELQQLRKSTAIMERELYIQELDARRIELSKKFEATKNKLEKITADRGSWSNRNKTRELDAEERKLAGWLSSIAAATRINSVLLKRLRSGATTFSEGTASPPQSLRERFFRTE